MKLTFNDKLALQLSLCLWDLPETSHKPGHGGHKREQDVQEEQNGEVEVIALGRASSGYDVIVRAGGVDACAVVEHRLVGVRQRGGVGAAGHARAEEGRAARQVADGLVEGRGDGRWVAGGRVDVALASLKVEESGSEFSNSYKCEVLSGTNATIYSFLVNKISSNSSSR